MATISNGQANASASTSAPIVLKRLDGETVADAVILPGVLQSVFPLQDIFDGLSMTPKADNTKEIAISEDGKDPLMVMGSHPGLHYRGNKLKRHKIWAQTEYPRGMLKYGYTGWQHAIAAASRDISAFPMLENMLFWLNESFASILQANKLPPCDAVFNHAIFTRYEDQDDFIGQHSDKEKVI